MTPQELKLGNEEASFFAACGIVSEYIAQAYGMSLSLREDGQGRLVLRVVGMREIVMGSHIDEGLGHLPHLAVFLGPKK